MEPVTLAFSSNDNHAMLLGVALCSIFENKKGDYPVQVFVMDGGISIKNKERLAVLERRYRFAIAYVQPDARLFEGIEAGDRSIAAFYRTVIDRLLPVDCRKVIYADCDVIFRGDVAELFYIDLGGKTVGVVMDDPQVWWREHIKKLCKRFHIPTTEDELWYFNSGVMLIDLDHWRKKNIGENLLRFIKTHPDALWVADQDPLNVVLFGDRKKLSARYNFLPVPVNSQSGTDPLIVHFAGGSKPWYVLSALPYQPDYVRYANMTPWKQEKYRKFIDVFFARKYHFYTVAWWAWGQYKKIRGIVY